MLVLVSFVLVLAAAVTLVVGLLQSGLTLIYLSIGCSVLAGVVLAVAVLRGRPEPKAAAPGRSFSPSPQSAQPAQSTQRAQAPASVGAPSSEAQSTSSWTPPGSSPPPSSPASTAPYGRSSDAPGEDVATKAAGAALLGRLRGKRGDQGGTTAPPEPVVEIVPAVGAVPTADATTEMPAFAPTTDDDSFPIPNYDRLRATELLSQLAALDRNQLETVREREANGKNRFTIMSRVDALLDTTDEPAWEVDDDEWDADAVAEPEVFVAEPEVLVAETVVVDDGYDDDFEEELEEAPSATGAGFPIDAYDTLTVGQILPRLSELGPEELAEVRSREEMGRGRGTILDRIDRLASRRAPVAMAMPAPAAPAPVRKAPARRAAGASKATAPATKRATKAPARRPAAVALPPVTKTAAPRTAAPGKTVAGPLPSKVAAPRKARAPKTAAPVVPVPPQTSTGRVPANRTKKA